MKYRNPVLPGFYPDPSVCTDGKKFYLVCSSSQYFPGVPLFESDDLVNWKQIGHVLTRDSQLPLADAGASGGIFAPTIRYHEGRFYMVTTNVSAGGNFYVYTDDIYGEWSEMIQVEQGGIDPSLYFENGKAYFMSNGEDDEGNGGITQCEIDIETGKKLTPSRVIWKGAGGRYLESPHLYKINGVYYLMAAEGGTEYGHMVVYAKGDNPYGPFENYYDNPVLTNRNLGGYQIQGCGHADLVQDKNGNWWMLHLAFRQIDRWLPFHITGRETYLVPVTFGEDGWFVAGDTDKTTRLTVDTERMPEINQPETYRYSFENTQVGKEWCYQRNPHRENYSFSKETFCLKATNASISDELVSPTFVAIRQQEMKGYVECKVAFERNTASIAAEAGVTLFMDEKHHYDLYLRACDGKLSVENCLCIGDVKSVQATYDLPEGVTQVKLHIDLDEINYGFKVEYCEETYNFATAKTRYISTEVACGFTGVMIGLYAEKAGDGEAEAVFSEFMAEMHV